MARFKRFIRPKSQKRIKQTKVSEGIESVTSEKGKRTGKHKREKRKTKQETTSRTVPLLSKNQIRIARTGERVDKRKEKREIKGNNFHCHTKDTSLINSIVLEE
jgi:nitrogen regulatory protein PII